MSMSTLSFSSILDDNFSIATPNEDLSLLRALKRLHSGPQTQHVALVDGGFPLSAYLLSHGVEYAVVDEPKHEIVAWNGSAGAGSTAGMFWPPIQHFGGGDGDTTHREKGELFARLPTGVMKFKYQNTEFLVYKVSWTRDRCPYSLFDLVFDWPGAVSGDGREPSTLTSPGHILVADVYRWAGALKDEMWVFQDGHWRKDRALWAAIRNASWDDIVLEEEFLEGLRRDTRTFFENRAIYQELGVVWKRGLLLLGPPGNGKTESIKVLLKESEQSALYVKSFSTPAGPEHGVRAIFDHARANAPCILVIEDLDSLVTPDVRSFFLNELDGLGQNEGILTIATTNHPERIDDAILNRPSRFDVKYDFALPSEQLRLTYALKWLRKICALTSTDKANAARQSVVAIHFEKGEDEVASEVAKQTEGWSFAFLKELFVSFLLRTAHDKALALARGTSSEKSPQTSRSILMAQLESLSHQIMVPSSDAEAGGEQKASTRVPNLMRYVRAKPVKSVSPVIHSGPNF